MAVHDQDFSFSTSSSIDSKDIRLKHTDFESLSLESYGNVFDKAQHNFTTSSEISFNLDNEQTDRNPLSTADHNKTPNPWRKLCTKNIEYHTKTDGIVPILVFSPESQLNQDKNIKLETPRDEFNITRQSRRYFLESGFQLKEKREELANQLLSIFNQDLSDKVNVVWSSHLTTKAGHCTIIRRNTSTAVITLSYKVCDSPGKFELIINNNRNDLNQQRQTPKKTINKYNLFVKENFQIMKQANPHLSTLQLMK